MQRLEDELVRARELAVDDLADAIESIGFECTRCGACCKGYEPDTASDDSVGTAAPDGDTAVSEGGEQSVEAANAPTDAAADPTDGPDREPHTATVFPDEVRRLRDGLNDGVTEDGDRQAYDWRDVARPTPYGLHDGDDGPEGETFEWALAVDDCGDCTFYDAGDGPDAAGTCTVYGDRPLVCQTYPFSVALGGVDEPMGEVVDGDGLVRAHECEGLGRDISREEAESLAATLKRRAIREITEAIAVRESYDPTDADGVVVHDSEGAKRPDGSPLDR